MNAVSFCHLSNRSSAAKQFENDLTLSTWLSNVSACCPPVSKVPSCLAGGQLIDDEGNIPQVYLQVGDGPYHIAEGERVTIPVLAGVVTGSTLGAATLIVEYDPDVVQGTSCTLNIDDDANGFDGGVCNLTYGTGQIKLSALSIAGVEGGTIVGWIEFEGVGSAPASTTLEVMAEHLTDSAADPLLYEKKVWTLRMTEVDDDGDGAPGSVEAGAPNDGDGNNDGIPDAMQENVVSLPNIVDGRYITLVSPAGTGLINVRATGNPSPATAPVGCDFPLGFLSFPVGGIDTGGAIAVEVFMPPVTVDTYHKYGPTLDNPTDHCYEFTYDDETGAQIEPDRIVLHFVDGKRGDSDLIATGEVSDPGCRIYMIRD